MVNTGIKVAKYYNKQERFKWTENLMVSLYKVICSYFYLHIIVYTAYDSQWLHILKCLYTKSYIHIATCLHLLVVLLHKIRS